MLALVGARVRRGRRDAGRLLAALALGGCGHAAVPSGEQVSLASGGEELANAVAVVDGQAISAEAVAREARASGVDARTALAHLVEADAIAAEAIRRGLDRAPEVREAMKRELVRRYLQTGFEQEVKPASISDHELQQAYDRNRIRLDHPDVMVVRHILAAFGGGPGAGPAADTGRRQRMHERMEKVRDAARARHITDAEIFVALAKEFSDDDIRLSGEYRATAEGWTVKPFNDAAFALKPRGPGAISDVVETKYGYHVLFFDTFAPAEHYSFAQAEAKLREGMWPDFQRAHFGNLIDALVQKHKVAVYAARLESEPGGEESPPAPPEKPAGP